MDNPIDGTGSKLGHGFTSADELKEIDIGPRDRPRPAYVNAKLDPEYMQELIDLLKVFKDYFAQEYNEMPGLDRSISLKSSGATYQEVINGKFLKGYYPSVWINT